MRFEIEEVVGSDIYGNKVQPEGEEVLEISLGEGIEMREPGKYYAVIEGMPRIEKGMISVMDVLQIKGDVDLKSGNVRFDGAAEIHGAIDMGAVVEVTGDLIVHGTIRGGLVTVGGNLDAKAGIITGEAGSVTVRGEIIAGFIENSNVRCSSDITVKKVLLNSRIFSGGEIKVPKKKGVIAGGFITSRYNITTGKLGFPQGAITEVHTGVDFRIMFRVEKLRNRLARLSGETDELRGSLRELTRKKSKTKQHVEAIEEYQKRLQRLRAITDRIKELLRESESSVEYDKDAEVIVYQSVYPNCRIEAGGSVVPVLMEVAEVAISARKVGGSNIRPIKEAGKKAS